MSKQSKFQYLIYSLLLALLIGGLIMWATGSNPFAVYAAVLTGSFGSLSGLMSVLAYTTPLILTGLGAVVAFQGGVFNIGGEGQLLVGGLAAVLTGIYVDLPQPLPLLLALIAGFAAGALWALIPTLMVGKNLAALFVGTVMMNSIGSSFTEYLVKYHFLREGASTTETPNVLDAAVLPRVMPNTQFNYGIIVAVVCVLLVAWILYRTPAGFAIRVVGANPNSARQAGINVYHKTLLTMVLSGGIIPTYILYRDLHLLNSFQSVDCKKSQRMQRVCGGASLHTQPGKDQRDESQGNHFYRRTQQCIRRGFTALPERDF